MLINTLCNQHMDNLGIVNDNENAWLKAYHSLLHTCIIKHLNIRIYAVYIHDVYICSWDSFDRFLLLVSTSRVECIDRITLTNGIRILLQLINHYQIEEREFHHCIKIGSVQNNLSSNRSLSYSHIHTYTYIHCTNSLLWISRPFRNRLQRREIYIIVYLILE